MTESGLRYCLDGRWLAAGEAAFAPSTSLIASGEGWFETLRVESGRLMFLERHLDRLKRSVSRSCGVAQATLASNAALRCLSMMAASFAEYSSGRLRLVLVRDELRALPDVGGWQALGEWGEYRASSASLSEGIDVIIASFAHPGLGFLGKSTSYHWSLAARQEAMARGASEALLVRDDEVLEGATGAILWRRDNRWFVHDSSAILPSVTVDALRDAGVALESGTLSIDQLDPASRSPVEGVILVSALRLAVSIRRCESHVLPVSTSVAAEWREALLALHRRDIA